MGSKGIHICVCVFVKEMSAEGNLWQIKGVSISVKPGKVSMAISWFEIEFPFQNNFTIFVFVFLVFLVPTLTPRFAISVTENEFNLSLTFAIIIVYL